MKKLVLASTSKYRQALLNQLGLPFEAQKPLIDEEKEKDPSLSPQQLAEKLAFLKAQSLKAPGHVVIGGDQLVAHRGKILGKPHTRERAIEQILSMEGQVHELITAICIFDGDSFTPYTDITRLYMKPLTRQQVERYVDLDQPLDCAGAYKIEQHGMMLFEKIESQDFSAIQGLPLLALSQILKNSGFAIP
ncbi:Maf family protein [Bdellovibrio sp. HCB337]|uniref:Maf family protein n=1 Tax=Bdellovibrio sp. HCB337 TaxID=3394358 RepID=UPI0039A68FFB